MRKAIAGLPSVRAEWLSGLLGLLCCCSLAAHAQEQSVGTVTHLSGTFAAKRSDGASRLLGVKSQVMQGDLLTTEADTFARIKLNDGGEVVLRPKTQFRIESFNYDAAEPAKDHSVVSLLKGGLRAVTGLIGQRSRDKVEFRTTTATIGIRGTNHGMLLCNEAHDCDDIPTISGNPPAIGLHVDVANGAVEVRNAGGAKIVNAGEFAYTASFQAPTLIVPASQGIQVTMPQAISANATEGRSIGGPARDTSCSF